MSLYLSHSSALQYWRSPSAMRTFRRELETDSTELKVDASQPVSRLTLGPALQHSPSSRLESADGACSTVLLPSGIDFDMPLHCLVSSAVSRRNTHQFVCHVDPNSVRDALFYRVSPGVSVCCPELVLLQLAVHLDYVELMKLAYEICGSYAISSVNPEGFICWNPALLTAGLARCRAVAIERARDRGSVRLRDVLRYVSPGSHSPAETKLAMMLSAPHVRGGLGLPAPAMNVRVPLSGSLQSLANVKSYLCDLVWPDKRLVVEYDSDQNHLNAEQHSRDLMKRQFLESDGYQVVSVSSSQLGSAEHVLQIAQHAAKRLGVRFRPRVRGFDSRWEDFHHEVLKG